MSGSERIGLAAVIGAWILGITYLTVAGAPARYVVLNAVALAIGLAGFFAIRRAPWPVEAGRLAIAIGAVLLVTALFGTRVEGASRWLIIGGLSIQPSLMLLPALCVLASRTDRNMLPAVLLAAAAMALQPDRAMAAALSAAMLTLWLMRRDRHGAFLLAVAVLGLAVTLVRADALPAVPFVDRILFTGFALSPLLGVAVWAGAAVLLLPAITGDLPARVHAATWAAIVAAAAFGNYPTPVVGYGSSAIIGYLLALAAFPVADRRRASADTAPRTPRDPSPGDLRTAH